MKNQGKLKDFSFQEEFYDSLGLEHFAIALTGTKRLKFLDISENDIGFVNFNYLQPIFKDNIEIEHLNLADCKINGEQTEILCKSLLKNKFLKYLFLRNSNIGDQGSFAISNLIANSEAIQELEIFNCGISDIGGNAIGNALKSNFKIEKLSIGDNQINKKDVEQIQQSVIFNTQYNQMKDANKKFEGFADTLIA